MKKKLLSVFLCAAMTMSLFTGCGGSGSAATGTDAGSTDASGDAEAVTETAASGEGSVYWLNFKPELDETIQELGKKYTETTGVPVKIVTAASGTYSQTLQSEMDKSEAPTLFVVGNAAGVKDWADYAIDLTGTKIADELSTDAYNLYDETGKLVSIGYCYECYGIIVNPDLIEKAGHSMDEIKNFEGLKTVAEDIHKNADTLGFDAFSSSDMDDSSSWRFTGHLANLEYFYEEKESGAKWEECPASLTGKYMENYKNLYDLIINNSLTDPKDLANGGHEEKAGLNCGTENCWAVNANASEADQQATIDFMVWLVSDPDASKAMVEQLGIMPYKNAVESSNGFLNDAAKYTADGCYVMDWATNYQPNVDDYRAALVAALNQYNADQSDANWDLVKAAFVDGWATQYGLANAD